MRIPLTKYGLPQVVVFPAIIFAAMITSLVLGTLYFTMWAVIVMEALLAAAFIGVLSFFRDPDRLSPQDNNVLLAPADGKVTDIEIVQENDFIDHPTLRIGIFLNIFNAHINRAPCNVKVEKITYRPGKYKSAMNPESARVNESNDLIMTRIDSPQDRLILRQISGAITRRIICKAKQGQELAGGEKFGMIKFGSRTELYLPARSSSCAVRNASCVKGLATESTEKELKFNSANSAVEKTTQYAIRDTQYEIKCLVQVGDKVKAGLTPIVKYEIRNT